MDKKTLLYLGARAFPLEKQAEIDAAHNQGFDVLMASTDPTLFEGFNLKWNIKVDLGNYELAEQQIIAFIKEKDIELSGVITWTDREVELVARLGNTLDLPASSQEAANIVRDKSITREVIEKSAPRLNPRYKVIRSENEFLNAVKVVGIPCIIKPCGNSGGRGIFKILNESDTEKVYEEYKVYNAAQKGDMYTYYTDKVLVEQLVEGSEHSLAGVIQNGKVSFFAISDKRIDEEIAFQFQNKIPSQLPVLVQEKLKVDCHRVLENIGLDSCGFHIDFIHSEDGPKILEVGGRLGGECINSHLIPMAFKGLKPYDLVLDSIQGTRSNVTVPEPNAKVGIRSVYSTKKGRIKAVNGVGELKDRPEVDHVVQLRFSGDEIASPRELYNSCRVVSFIAKCGPMDDLDQIMDELASRVEIEVESI